MTRQIAIYGKGGIGKSTVSSHLCAALAELGKTVLLVGCDPKADSTFSLLGGGVPPTILELISGGTPSGLLLDTAVVRGYAGVLCCEAGGPEPGVGCAGRGIIVAIDALRAAGAYEKLDVDIVVYDVPGDVVCGGFAMPLRKGFAQEAYIVSSPEYASLYAANNIAKGIARFAPSGGASLGGIIANMRSKTARIDAVCSVAASLGSRLAAVIPWDPSLPLAERDGMTLFEHGASSPTVDAFIKMASLVLEPESAVPVPLSRDTLAEICRSASY
jgi:nitrogenase iron protein NifH